jgi:hypothetical protein
MHSVATLCHDLAAPLVRILSVAGNNNRANNNANVWRARA